MTDPTLTDPGMTDRQAAAAPRAPALNLLACEACGRVVRLAAPTPRPHCPRCAAPLRRRKPNSVARCWAFLIAAAILYVPANVLPVMHTSLMFESENDTILSGVLKLWRGGSWDLAAIVFTASIVVPLMKIGTLALLLITTQRRSRWRQRERTRLYRLVEFVGHWSMLDVFVVALLVTLVHFGALADVEPGSGIVAFGAVVVLTMLASQSFDPRLIWDVGADDAPAPDHAPAQDVPPLHKPPEYTT
jgi:paraquat-inducible protein A